jgi:rhamnosyltransferase
MEKITADIFIPTYRPGPETAELLRRLANQVYPVRQVLIVNTDEKYWDPELENLYPGCRVQHIRKEEFDHGGTRDWMARQSAADILIFMTQDALPADNRLITRLLEPFADPQVKAAYARQLPRKDCGVLESFARKFNYPPESRVKSRADLPELGIKTFFCSDVCAAYDRKTYMKLGGFPHPVTFNEDMLYASRLIDAGYRIAYTAEAEVYHSHDYSGRQQFHRNFDLAVSQAQHPEVFGKYPSEGEGIRLVKQTAKHVCRIRKPWLLFPLVWQSGCKYAGYWLGKRHEKLPGWMVKKLSGRRG